MFYLIIFVCKIVQNLCLISLTPLVLFSFLNSQLATEASVCTGQSPHFIPFTAFESDKQRLKAGPTLQTQRMRVG